nr:hypothetical protein [Providencia burhodogranariea]
MEARVLPLAFAQPIPISTSTIAIPKSVSSTSVKDTLGVLYKLVYLN